MKANELMIGDWVKIKTYGVSDKYERTEAYIYVKIAGIGSGLITVGYNNEIKESYRICENTEIEPIQLTAEILENNGWKLYEPSTKMYIKSNSNLAVCFPPHSDKVQVYYVVEHLRTIKYVHEFQHILLALGFDADMKIP